MRKLLSLAMLLVLVFATSCKSDEKKNEPAPIEEVVTVIETISTSELEKLGNDIQLVDVRTPEEFEQGYIKNAINLNVKSDEFLEQTILIDKSKPVYVYCMAGVRSTKAAEKLKDAGFTKVYNYTEGYGTWLDQGKQISMD
ncbi:rhodanese-like domain-containing protein [Urechidicola vernalis]|uniref:Rhodanese-like domain-containing protein n=1 Tax=Urechidicola vernalis TaxID=3075600 RepID=A0ABU2Y426_9FLAO|nr:rhodanese-like domain-containing protein [Urechidicola sp. P050]MDT0552951.1 rhodanese-like domain-containing protein [Urechidicola sp. P050]